MLTSDYLEIIDLLKTHNVEFVIVGAYAMGAFGYVRATGDIDILINPRLDNTKKLIKALTAFGAPLDSVSSEDFTKPEVVFQIGIAPVRIDILTSIDGVSFADIQPEQHDIGGVTAPVIDLKNLLLNKQSTGRLRDLADCEELKKRI
ncbi:MAG: hypothetical protein ACE5F3_06900 [Mariprofundaceae bacterium]